MSNPEQNTLTSLTDIIATLPTKKVCFFKLKDKKYLTENEIEITTEMLVKFPHQIMDTWSFIVLD
jgi:glutaredoxin